jgi:hypothetical protein
VVGPSPEFGIDVQSLAYWQRANATGSWQIANFDPTINDFLAKSSSNKASILDPIGALCHGIICSYKQDDQFLYMDYGHFSAIGSNLAVRALRLGMQPLEIQSVTSNTIRKRSSFELRTRDD